MHSLTVSPEEMVDGYRLKRRILSIVDHHGERAHLHT
jgi:hypothetical protein